MFMYTELFPFYVNVYRVVSLLCSFIQSCFPLCSFIQSCFPFIFIDTGLFHFCVHVYRVVSLLCSFLQVLCQPLSYCYCHESYRTLVSWKNCEWRRKLCCTLWTCFLFGKTYAHDFKCVCVLLRLYVVLSVSSKWKCISYCIACWIWQVLVCNPHAGFWCTS